MGEQDPWPFLFLSPQEDRVVSMDSLVRVSKEEDPYRATREVLEQFPLPELKGKSVLIKPNAARVALPGQGVTTHPSVVEATIDCLRERGAREITIGESCIFGVDAREAFRATGMKDVSEKRRVSLVDFDDADSIEVPVPDGKVLQKIRIPAALKQFDFIISIPVMKTHMHTQVTLSLKNMKGLLWRKEKARFHHLRATERVRRGEKELDLAISEMASVLFPHLAIIDGSVGMEGMGPAYGTAKRMGIVLAGNNPLSADAVASRLMGFDPERIPHLRLTAEKGLGEIRLQNIFVQPEDYLQWETRFNPPPSKLAIPFPDVVVHDEGSCSACLSTLVVFLQRYHTQLSRHAPSKDGKTHIGIGKHLKGLPMETILIGNCASRRKERRIWVQGCPPVTSEIWNVLTENEESRGTR